MTENDESKTSRWLSNDGRSALVAPDFFLAGDALAASPALHDDRRQRCAEPQRHARGQWEWPIELQQNARGTQSNPEALKEP